MADETQSAFHELLALRGVTRRDFMKFCGSVAGLLGLTELHIPQIAAAVTHAADLYPTIWMNFGSCSGCTESLAQVDSPDVATIVLDLLTVNYNETIMAAAGEAAEAAKDAAVEAGGYLLVVEGSIMNGEDGNTFRLAGRTGLEHLEEAAANCDAIICVGSCAVDGGWVRANPNGVEWASGAKDVAADLGFTDKPLINLPTCPVNPEWIVAIVVDWLLLDKTVPELDEVGRPKSIFGQTIHDNCPRRGHFENNEFVETFGSDEEAKGYCLYKMGCKGPTTLTNCPIVRWNRRASWCVESGSPCIGCGSLNWVDNNMPALQHLADVGATVDPETIGLIAGGATLAGLVVHGIAQTATGRMGSGAPSEGEKGGDE